ncbi:MULTISPECIES: hypothetical protein [unclassified Leisingera]|uniref:hypothetical protein n=1 Tax=unclassified Leisingera TaxID=2614906 RepID=UPI0003680FCA|nr:MULTISPECIES: hypothetical protein [unclassified Leisingera]KIC55229.1 hypothetical protein RA22_00245 [Leisingera sp. ANG-S]KID08961.1 hypothetical protein GC1_09630 [Leisingera sp. ANG1]
MSDEKVISDLKALARSASEQSLWDIARSDGHGSEYERRQHFEALNELIHRQNCEITNHQELSWYPLEAIELCSHVFVADRSEAFAVATALLIIDDLRTGSVDYMGCRMSKGVLANYELLPKRLREPLQFGVTAIKTSKAYLDEQGADQALRAVSKRK